MAPYKSPELDDIAHHLDGMIDAVERYRNLMRQLQKGDLQPGGRYWIQAQETRASRLLDYLDDVVSERFREIIDRTPSIELAKAHRL